MIERFFWQFFSYFGDVAYWLGFSIAFLLIYPLLSKSDKAKTRWIVVELIPIVLISYLIATCLKFLFLVPRPCFGLEDCPLTPSFPSGHATIAFAFSTVIVARLRERKYLLFFGLAFLVALSRIMLGVHAVVDVVAGSVLGIAVGAAGVAARRVRLNHFYLRKTIHLLCIAIIPIEFLFGKNITAALILLTSLLYLISEILRVRKIKFPFFQQVTKACYEQRNLKNIITTPLYFASGIIVLLLLFPKNAFYFGAVAIILGDGMAGIFGKKFGRIKIFYNRRKTLEGSIACFFSTFLPFLLLTNFLSAAILAFFATFLESLLKKYENFILPVGVGTFSLFI